MGVIGQALIEVVPDASKFATKLSGDLKEGVEKAEGGASSSFGRIADVGQKAFLGLSAAAIGFGAVAVAEALKGEQSQAQLKNAIKNSGDSFEELEPKIDKLTAGFAKFGIQNDDAEAALARLVQMTGNSAESMDLLTTAANLAAARHIDLTTAATLVGKAAEGNVTALKRYGIQVTSTGDSVKDGAAAIALLNEKFGGAAQAEADTYAGKLRAFKAEVSNLEEKVGQALIPTLAHIAEKGAAMIEFFEKNRIAAGLLAAVVGGPLVLAIGAYLIQETRLAVAKTAEILGSIAGAAATAAIKMGILAVDTETGAVAMTTFGTATVVATGGLALIIAKMIDAKAKANDFAQGIIKAAGPEPQNQLEALKKKQQELLDKFDDTPHLGFVWLTDGAAHAKNKYDAVTKDINKLTESIAEGEKARGEEFDTVNKRVITGLDEQGGAVKGLSTEYGVSSEVLQAVADKMKIDLTKATDDQTAALNKQIERLQVANPTTLELRDALEKLNDKTADATEKSKAFKTALDLLIGANVDADKAVVTFYNSIDTLGEKLKAGGTNLDFHTQKGRENIGAIDDSVTAIGNHITAMQRQGAGADDVRRAFEGDTKALDDQLKKAGFTAGQIDELNKRYALVPNTITTIIGADFSALYDAASAVDQKFKTLFGGVVATGGKGGTLRTFDTGGYVPGPVGAPQLAVVHGGEYVLTAQQAQAGKGAVTIGAGAVSINQSFGVGTSPEVMAMAAKMARAEVTAALEEVLGVHTAIAPAGSRAS